MHQSPLNGALLYRPKEGRYVGGVCCGVAAYVDMPAWAVRGIWLLAALGFGSGIALYVLAWMVMFDAQGKRVANGRQIVLALLLLVGLPLAVFGSILLFWP